jgi:hypothetical protein
VSTRIEVRRHQRHGRLEVQMSMGGTAWAGGHATCACLGLVGPLVSFFFSCSFSGKNNDARKILAPFEFRKIPET